MGKVSVGFRFPKQETKQEKTEKKQIESITNFTKIQIIEKIQELGEEPIEGTKQELYNQLIEILENTISGNEKTTL